jgi:hypothetical protein
MRCQTGRHEYENIMQNMPPMKQNFCNVLPILLMAYWSNAWDGAPRRWLGDYD